MNAVWRSIEYLEQSYSQLVFVAPFIGKEMLLTTSLIYTNTNGFTGAFSFGPHTQTLAANKNSPVALVSMFNFGGKSIEHLRNVVDQFMDLCQQRGLLRSFQTAPLAEGELGVKWSLLINEKVVLTVNAAVGGNGYCKLMCMERYLTQVDH